MVGTASAEPAGFKPACSVKLANSSLLQEFPTLERKDSSSSSTEAISASAFKRAKNYGLSASVRLNLNPIKTDPGYPMSKGGGP